MTVKVTSDALYVIATVLLGGGVIYALVTRGAVPGPALGIGMLVLFIAAAQTSVAPFGQDPQGYRQRSVASSHKKRVALVHKGGTRTTRQLLISCVEQA